MCHLSCCLTIKNLLHKLVGIAPHRRRRRYHRWEFWGRLSLSVVRQTKLSIEPPAKGLGRREKERKREADDEFFILHIVNAIKTSISLCVCVCVCIRWLPGFPLNAIPQSTLLGISVR